MTLRANRFPKSITIAMAPALLYDSDEAANSAPWTKMCTRTPKVARLDFESYRNEAELVADISQSLKVSGGCIVRGLYKRSTIDALEEEIRPHIRATTKADQKREDFVPSSTRMVTGLLSKSRTYALSVAGNDLWHRVCEHFLTSRLTNSWVSQTPRSMPWQLTLIVAWDRSPE